MRSTTDQWPIEVAEDVRHITAVEVKSSAEPMKNKRQKIGAS
jgi:hypothetical protein